MKGKSKDDDGKRKIKKSETETKKDKDNIKIMQWKFNQFLGEKLTYEQIKNDPENESFLITDIKFSDDGTKLVVSDRGGRIIIFNIKEGNKKEPEKLDYFYEFIAQEKDFDVHKSVEYSEEIKSISLFPTEPNSNKLDILTAGYRTIRLNRIYQNNVSVYNNEEDGYDLSIPKVVDPIPETKSKIKKQFVCTYSSNINTLSINKINKNNFISSDDYKVFLWDINLIGGDVYNPIDLEKELESENEEKITKCCYSESNPNLFIYGTNRGTLKLCDMRIASSKGIFESNFSDKQSEINSQNANYLSYSLSSIHDINTKFNNEYLFCTRNYLYVNIWDTRKSNEIYTKFATYEPIVTKMPYLYQNNYIADKFSVDISNNGKYIITGGYNNMFHIIDVSQRLNTQIIIDDSNQTTLNTNIIRKVNGKGSCHYKRDDPQIYNINFDKKILHQAFSPASNYILLVVLNCLYSYNGGVAKKK